MNAAVDLEAIWNRQLLPSEMQIAIVSAAKVVNDIIVNPPAGQRNISEWAKQQACWSAAQKARVQWSQAFLDTLLSTEEVKTRDTQGKKQQRQLNGIDAQTTVISAGKEYWTSVAEWGLNKRLLTETDMDILRTAMTWTSRPRLRSSRSPSSGSHASSPVKVVPSAMT